MYLCITYKLRLQFLQARGRGTTVTDESLPGQLSLAVLGLLHGLDFPTADMVSEYGHLGLHRLCEMSERDHCGL